MRLFAVAVLAVVSSSCAHVSATDGAQQLSRAEKRKLRREGTQAYEQKNWNACVAAFERAGDAYSTACCLALAGQPERAFAQLDLATKKPTVSLQNLREDQDLQSLHGDPRWASTVDRMAAAIAARAARGNAELAQLLADDQADRAGPMIEWAVVGPRDHARQKRVLEIVTAGGAKTANDYFAAAMVYQHADTPADYQRAHDWALEALRLDPDDDRARWLAAASEDRRLMNEQKPQKYGTQFQQQNGVWVLWEVDPSTTDAEREEWNVPPLADQRRMADEMNAPAKPLVP